MPDFAALEQQYGLPPGFLAAQQAVESAGGRDLTSSAGAQGPAQLMPATARALHVNPHDPEQAARAQAIIMRQNLDATGGDIDQAAMMYHGGTDRRQWGPKTQAYPAKILAALTSQGASASPAPASSDPFENVLAGHTAPATNDPFEAVLAGDKSGGNGAPNGILATLPAPGAGVPGDQAGSGVLGDNRGVPPGGQAPGGGAGGGQASPAPALPGGTAGDGSTGGLAPGAAGVADYYKGLAQGSLYDIPADALGLGARATDAIGLTDGALGRVDSTKQAVQQKYIDPLYNDPNDWSRSIGRTAGQIIAGAPLSEVAPLEGLGVAAKLPTLAKYGDMAMQGAGFGAITSGGHDVAQNAAIGALAAPALGAVISKGLPLLMAGAKGVGGTATKLAEALKARIPEAAPETPIPDDPAFLKPYAEHPGPLSPEEMAQFQAQNPDGLVGEVTGEDPAPPLKVTPQQMGAAIGNRAAKRGIESTQELPPAVAARYQELSGQGVPDAEAIRQADIEGVGASPTVATVTRTPDDMRAMFEGAKAGTPEGNALSSVIADNGAALHNHVQGMVEDLGGIPAEGSGAQEAAQALADASDAEKTKVSAAYAGARELDGDQRVSIDALRELLTKPEYQAPTTAEGSALVNGLNNQIDAMAKANGGRFSPEGIDQLTKSANAAYNPMGGGANHMVGEIKSALGESLDQFDNAGPAFKQARALHRQWAEQYDDPQGIATLIKRDAKGNFVKDDSWRAAENIVGSKDDKSFIQIVNQLQKNGSTDALNRLKATVVQRAYEKAAQGAADRAGNQTINGNRWFTELNKIGLPKLQALFSPAEMADLAHVGRAAIHLNEAVPGSVNTSGTASVLLDALGKQGKGASKPVSIGARVIGHTLAAATGTHGAANVGVEAAMHGADKMANARAAAKLAAGIRQMMDPDIARAAANENAISQAERLRRITIANAIATRIAPAAAADRGSR